MDLIKLRNAALELGISYPTLKQWIYNNKIRSVKTAGGHHRIPQTEIKRILGQNKKQTAARRPVGLETISGRNKIAGTVAEVRFDGLLAQVLIDIGAGQQMVSIITADSARALDLKKGADVFALVKATEVMVIRN